MNIQFSTNDSAIAKQHILKALPDISEDRLNRFLKAVDDGLIRVGDPFMYNGQSPIYPTEKGSVLGNQLAEMLS